MKRFYTTFIVLSSLIFFGCSSLAITFLPAGGKQIESKFEATIKINVGINYLLYVPANYDRSNKLPLMMFLHGAGERGDTLELIKSTALQN